MYKVFVNDKPIILTSEISEDKLYKTYPLKYVDLPKVVRDLKRGNNKGVYLYHKNKDKLLQKFLKKFPNVIAGGGKVINDKGKVLFIYRNNKWDLPKGRVENKESIGEGAIREVEEETGVKGLTITKPLEITYHIFKRNGRYKIKITHWFEMKTSYDGKLTPETKEGITKVKWLGKKKQTKALENSYANIRELM
ncbi:NUDIX hydrolase [Pontimicrobium aquaticum]|uniref:NUDIX domain-containing protein n=1 Tax=Pontimicrobium aquaticum TaxID=2565367 RepID=A0A4U0EZF8_9FLAO|nr:NUDIX domain-containing protein [Pontimicrobium aquaticum]TJY37340.1 NUDIX domain-containing protein [Pontimicrobium aquaticum]